QVRIAAAITAATRIPNFSPIGSGKTIVTLTAIVDKMAAGQIERAIVIAPPNVCDNVWVQEAQSWDHTVHLRIVRFRGTPEARRRALVASWDVVVTSYELGPDLIEAIEAEIEARYLFWPAQLVVFDESSFLKNASSKRFATALEYR